MEGIPATPRDRAWIWATWVAGYLAGPKCAWQLWFRANHWLETKMPDDPDAPMWRDRHEALVDELDRQVLATGVVTERELPLQLTYRDGVVIKGSADLVATRPEQGAIDIYEVKGGRPQDSDRFQLWLYMWMMAETLERDEEWDIGGWLVRRGTREPHPAIPERFEDAVDEALAFFTGPEPAGPTPGGHCRFCPLTEVDCPVRPD